jgi:hypothetical protein
MVLTAAAIGVQIVVLGWKPIDIFLAAGIAMSTFLVLIALLRSRLLQEQEQNRGPRARQRLARRRL